MSVFALAVVLKLRGRMVVGEFKGTPGPWEWQTPMGEHCPWIVQAGKQAYEWEPIATLGDCTEDGPSPRSKAFQRVQADARLIAAAPDLLAALQAFNVTEANIVSGTADTLTIRVPIAVIQQAASAIAKALGQEAGK